MAVDRSWSAYPLNYRAKEIKVLAGWIQAGVSGSVVGLGGAGKSNLLGFVCHRPDAIQSYLAPPAAPPLIVPVDLNNLVSGTLSIFYRMILRSFYEARERVDPSLQPAVARLYLENRAERDPFISQSALRELLFEFQARRVKVVWVLDRFDKFCQAATPHMLDTLRGLRDSFKDTLCCIVGLRQQVAYLFDPAELGEMYEILDTHVCWVGAMDEADARRLIAEETSAAICPLDETEIALLLALTGGYPALLKAACHWRLDTPACPALAEWADALLKERSIQARLQELWAGLTQEEQLALAEMHKRPGGTENAGQHHHALACLADKGLTRRTDGDWRIVGDLLAAYVAQVGGRGGGRIWLDEKTGELYQGDTLLGGLAPLERAVLQFLVRFPRIRHAKTDLIVNTWPDELRRQGVTDDSLYQVIRELRKKVEPDPAHACYIVTWRGQPEGGYQFFPEGRPG